MNARAPRAWEELRTGLLVLLCLLPLSAGVFFLDALRRDLIEGPTMVVVADEIRGLEPGADVWVAGKAAGRVTAVSFLDPDAEAGSIALRLVLHHEAASAMRGDARARIGRSALLAPAVVKLEPGSAAAPPYDFGDTLVAAHLLDVEAVRALADSGRAALVELTDGARRLSTELRAGGGTLPRLRRDGDFLAELPGRRARLARLRAAWLEGSGVPAAFRDTALSGTAGRVRSRLRRVEGGAADTLRLALADRLDGLGRRLERLAERMESAEGTLGRLASDDELRAQAARTSASLDSLRLEIGKDPLRYLRFRLF